MPVGARVEELGEEASVIRRLRNNFGLPPTSMTSARDFKDANQVDQRPLCEVRSVEWSLRWMLASGNIRYLTSMFSSLLVVVFVAQFMDLFDSSWSLVWQNVDPAVVLAITCPEAVSQCSRSCCGFLETHGILSVTTVSRITASGGTSCLRQVIQIELSGTHGRLHLGEWSVLQTAKCMKNGTPTTQGYTCAVREEGFQTHSTGYLGLPSTKRP